jgi:hypothetical protein
LGNGNSLGKNNYDEMMMMMIMINIPCQL